MRSGLGFGMFKKFSPVRRDTPRDTFGTIFESELSAHYQAKAEKPDTAKLVQVLQGMQGAGIRTVVFSASWIWAEAEEGKVRMDYFNWIMDCACKNTQLKVDLILDLMHPPPWIWTRFHDAQAYDTDNRTYPQLSWFHPFSRERGLRFLSRVASHLVANYHGCVAAIQPSYNNEYEAKYTQERDAFQDYSPYALAAYREWLRSRAGDLAVVNARWGTKYKHWDEVVPPKLHNGNWMGVDFSASYWDFLRFREEYGAGVYNGACAAVKRAGLQCFHHFPEFFTAIDAIYGASMFKRIAASPHTDFVIMDSNFRTPYGVVMDPVKLRMYIAAARSYGKPVYFEAAVERFANMSLLEASFRNSLLAGGENLGITNWHTRVEMGASLAAAMRPAPPACAPCELVGVFLHLDSCSAFHGLQWAWKDVDPLHHFVEDLARRLSARCSTDIAVYVELDRFLADIPTFSRAVFVEPALLYDSAELASYIAVKDALRWLPHQVLRLPLNITSGPSMVVLQDMPGVAAVSAAAGRPVR